MFERWSARLRGLAADELGSRRNPMRVYVAAKFEEKDRVRQMIGVLRNMGHQITHDWTLEETQFDSSKHENLPYYKKCAEGDAQGVMTADVFIILTSTSGKGLYVEMGMAAAKGLPIIAVGPHFNSIFYELPNVTKVQTIEAAYVMLEEARKKLAVG